MPIQLPLNSTTALQAELTDYYGRINTYFGFTQSLFNTGDNLIYNNPLGLAPSIVAASLSTNGQAILAFQALLANTLSTITGAAPASNAGLFSTMADPNNVGGIIVVPVHNAGPLSTLGGNNV